MEVGGGGALLREAELHRDLPLESVELRGVPFGDHRAPPRVRPRQPVRSVDDHRWREAARPKLALDTFHLGREPIGLLDAVSDETEAAAQRLLLLAELPLGLLSLHLAFLLGLLLRARDALGLELPDPLVGLVDQVHGDEAHRADQERERRDLELVRFGGEEGEADAAELPRVRVRG